MAKTTVEVEIVAVLKEAQKAIESFAGSTQKQLDGLNFRTGVSAIADGFKIIEETAGRAFDIVKELIGEAISEAVEGEEALTKLSNSMRLVGDFSQGAVDNFKDFADQLQRTTTNSDDAVLSALALAKNFNLTNKEAREATAAAVDFAAATGKDLDSAVQSLSRSLTGVVDRDLARYLPQLKASSKENLVLGEAVRAVSERFRGFATALGGTFNGSIKQTSNAFKDLLESIGQIIITNPVLIKSIQIIGDTFRSLKGEVEDNQGAISVFVSETVKEIAAALPVIINIAKTIDFIISSIVNLFRAVGTGLAGLLAGADAAINRNFSGAREVIQQSAKDILEIYGNTSKRLDGFYDPLIKSAKAANEKIQKLGLATSKDSKITLGISKTDAQIVSDRMRDALAEGAEDLKKKIQEAFEAQKKLVGELAKNPFTNLFPEKKAGDKKAFTDSQEQSIATGAGGLSSILKGAAGATELVKGFASAAAEALVPGLGPVVGEIVGVLAQGKEKVREMIREFVKAVPEVITAIIEAIPVLIEEISKGVPEIVKRLLEKVPEIVNALAKEMPAVATALALQMPKTAIALATGIIKNIPQIVKGFIDGLIDGAKQFIQALIDGISGGISDVGNGLTGGGQSDSVFAGIPVLQGIGDLFGFADGGRVPDVPRFNNDGLLARLSSNEQVLNGDLTDRLERFLDGADGGQQTMVVQFVASDKVMAEQIFRLKRNGHRLGFA